MKILLASNSPRRRQLLKWTGWDFRSIAPEINEDPSPAGESPAEYVTRLAREKAYASLDKTAGGEIILAADTTVADGDLLLGKPSNGEDAASMLRRLRGRSHQVYTAITIIDQARGSEVSDMCVAMVPMRAYTDAEIEAYIASGDPFDKAGGYAIQHPVFAPVESLSDCYACVMGLPLCHVVRSMRLLGYQPAADVWTTCQRNLHYACPVFQAVLEHEV